MDGNQFDKFGAKYFTLDNYNMLYTSVNDKLKSSTDYGDNWKDIEIVEGANLAAYQAEYTF